MVSRRTMCNGYPFMEMDTTNRVQILEAVIPLGKLFFQLLSAHKWIKSKADWTL